MRVRVGSARDGCDRLSAPSTVSDDGRRPLRVSSFAYPIGNIDRQHIDRLTRVAFCYLGPVGAPASADPPRPPCSMDDVILCRERRVHQRPLAQPSKT